MDDPPKIPWRAKQAKQSLRRRAIKWRGKVRRQSTPQQQLAFRLRLKGYTFKAIAKKLAISPTRACQLFWTACANGDMYDPQNWGKELREEKD